MSVFIRCLVVLGNTANVLISLEVLLKCLRICKYVFWWWRDFH